MLRKFVRMTTKIIFDSISPTFSFLMSSAWIEAGFSIATNVKICNKWFCITSLMMPNSSKYPPLPWVPNGSLNVIWTDAMLSLFQVGLNILFPNLKTVKCKNEFGQYSTMWYKPWHVHFRIYTKYSLILSLTSGNIYWEDWWQSILYSQTKFTPNKTNKTFFIFKISFPTDLIDTWNWWERHN